MVTYEGLFALIMAICAIISIVILILDRRNKKYFFAKKITPSKCLPSLTEQSGQFGGQPFVGSTSLYAVYHGESRFACAFSVLFIPGRHREIEFVASHQNKMLLARKDE